MDKHLELLTDIRDHLRNIAISLNNINGRLDRINGRFSLDDVAKAISEIKANLSTNLESTQGILDHIEMNTNGLSSMERALEQIELNMSS